MKFLSAVLCLFASVAASKVSNAVPSSKPHHADSSVEKARPARDLQYRYGQPVYKTFEELQRASSPYQTPAYQPFADYSNPSARTCFDKKKKEPVYVQPVYIPVQAPHQEYHQEYQHVSVPYTTYQQITVPHTEYHQVSVPVHQPVQYQYHSVQQYYPESQKKPCCFKSADGASSYPAELPTQYQTYGPEYANPALKESSLYQAIEKSAIDRNADMNRYAQYQDTGRSAQMYQAQYQPNGKAAYAQVYENAEVPEMRSAAPEMKSAAAPEMKSAAAPEMKSAAAPELNRNAAYQADGRAAQVYQKNAAADYGRQAVYADATYADMTQRNARIPEWNYNSAYPNMYQRDSMYADMNQQHAFLNPWAARNTMYQPDGRSAYAPEFSRNAAYADMYQRDAIAPEFSRNAAYADMYQRDAIAPEYSRNAAYADMYQRDAIAPEYSRNAAYADMYQRDAIAPEWNRNAVYADMYQRDAIAPEFSRNAMYQPDGRYAYADMYHQPRSGFMSPGFGRNAEIQATEKSAPVLKAAVPEKTPASAPKESDSNESAAKLSSKKGY